MTPSMYVASLAWTLLAAGYLMRPKRQLHVRLMVSGIALDLSLVLYLQLTRDAVQKALAFDLGPLQQTHIAFSSLAVALYFPTLALGAVLYRRGGAEHLNDSVVAKQYGILRQWHIRFALSAFAARTLGLLFMFSLLKRS